MRMSTAPVVFWTLFFLRPVRPIFDLRPLWDLARILGSDFAFSRFRSSFMLFFFENADCEGELFDFDKTEPSLITNALFTPQRGPFSAKPSLVQGVIWRFTSKSVPTALTDRPTSIRV